MKKNLSREEAREKINELFKREEFTSEEVGKIRKIAMGAKIRLGEDRKKYCKKCLSKLAGKTRIFGSHKSILCKECGHLNRFKLSQKK